MKKNLPTSIPAHYRKLGESELYCRGDLYISPSGTIGRCWAEEGKVSDWAGFTFYRRRHISTKSLTPLQRAKKEVVEHWTRLANGTSKPDESTDMTNCAFCRMFWGKDGGRCNQCPIGKFTGEEYCNGSPYVSAGSYASKNDPEFKRKAAIFLDWLKKLPIED